MLNSKAIEENEFMPKQKILLLRTVATLKRLGGNEGLIEELVEKARGKTEDMLVGFLEKLEALQQKYREGSIGYRKLQEIIDEIEGGN